MRASGRRLRRRPLPNHKQGVNQALCRNPAVDPCRSLQPPQQADTITTVHQLQSYPKPQAASSDTNAEDFRAAAPTVTSFR